MHKFTDDDRARRGRIAEIAALSVLHHWGWTVIATADYSGQGSDHAPISRGANVLILPDFDTAKRGLRVFVEVKLKRHANPWRKSGQPEHGINAPNYAHYLEMERNFGTPVVLFVIEEDTGCLLANSLAALGPPRASPNPDWNIVNWERRQFCRLAQLDPRRLGRLLYEPMDHGGRIVFAVRDPPERLTPDFLGRVARYLRPPDPELELQHYDLMAAGAQPAGAA